MKSKFKDSIYACAARTGQTGGEMQSHIFGTCLASL